MSQPARNETKEPFTVGELVDSVLMLGVAVIVVIFTFGLVLFVFALPRDASDEQLCSTQTRHKTLSVNYSLASK